jgi:hypothetical protein
MLYDKGEQAIDRQWFSRFLATLQVLLFTFDYHESQVHSKNT